MNSMSTRTGTSESQTAATETTFVFDHIPKTGGTALRTVFGEIFGAEQISPHVTTRSEAWARKNFASYRMVTGHFLPLRSDLPDDGRIRLTVLRHPFERTISEYYWYRHDTDAVAGGDMALLARAHDFDEYLVVQEKKKAGINPNVYARHFASQLTREVTDNAQILSLAKEAMSRYQFVGITEALTDTIDFFCCEYDLPLPAQVPKVNTTSSRKALTEIDPETIRRLGQIYDLDLELYQLALAKFQNRKRQILRAMSTRRPYTVGSEIVSDGVLAEAATPVRTIPRPTDFGKAKLRGRSWLQFLRPRGSTPTPPHDGETVVARSSAKPAPSLRGAENFGNLQVEFISARVWGDLSGRRYVHSGEQINVTLILRTQVKVRDLTIGIAIVDSMGVVAYGTNTHLLDASKTVERGKYYEVTFRCKANLNKDYYFVNASAHTGPVHTNCCFHWREHITELDIVDSGTPQFEGYARLEPEVTWVERISAQDPADDPEK